ncbi:MAG: alanine/glycine:cation symporter family protein [Bacteriovoracaceae bacterium]
MSEFLQNAADFIWGLPLLVFIFIVNIILIYHSKFLPLRGFIHAIKLLGEKKEESSEAEGEISHFEAFCNAIAATVGLGNISGVAVAIATGGPGALFWMWVAAFCGMNTKFFECSVAQLYRGRDYRGDVQGGAMYVIEKALSPKLRFLSYMFAICGLIGTLSLFQINQIADYGETYYGVSKLSSGIIFSLMTFLVLLGGLKGISKFCSTVVPVMSVLYFIVAMVIVFLNIEKVPGVFTSVISEALNPSAAFGGIAGYSFMRILTIGLKRATFSNEAGIGTAPMAHSNSKTSEPISEGYVSMLGPFLDTIIVCSLTAIVILVSFPNGAPQYSGIQLTNEAFVMNLGPVGQHFLAITILLFATSTMIGMANYNQKCWDYLFKGRFGLGRKTFLAFYSGSILVGALIPMMNVINLMDVAFALMTIPNVVATLYLAPKVKDELLKYNKKRLSKI